MLTIRAMSDGKGYSAKHLANNDYYAEGERITGEWRGRGAELLGLNGAVSVEDFEAIRQGLDPRTKEFLRARQSADRITPDGTTLSHGRNLYELKFSAPKSVSILAILNNDPRFIDAHRAAVKEALDEAELQALARVRQRGSNADRLTGNLVLAVYHHDASRELDPQTFSSVSPKKWHRSLCPTMTCEHPAALIMEPETSPVKAPSSSQ